MTRHRVTAMIQVPLDSAAVADALARRVPLVLPMHLAEPPLIGCFVCETELPRAVADARAFLTATNCPGEPPGVLEYVTEVTR